MSKNAERNRQIIAYAEKHDWSYQLVAEHFGVTRNVVSGVVFRHRYPHLQRVPSPGSSGNRNKIGTGYRRPTYRPAVHAGHVR